MSVARGGVHVAFRGGGDIAKFLFGGGINRRERSPFASRSSLAVNQEMGWKTHRFCRRTIAQSPAKSKPLHRGEVDKALLDIDAHELHSHTRADIDFASLEQVMVML